MFLYMFKNFSFMVCKILICFYNFVVFSIFLNVWDVFDIVSCLFVCFLFFFYVFDYVCDVVVFC